LGYAPSHVYNQDSPAIIKHNCHSFCLSTGLPLSIFQYVISTLLVDETRICLSLTRKGEEAEYARMRQKRVPGDQRRVQFLPARWPAMVASWVCLQRPPKKIAWTTFARKRGQVYRPTAVTVSDRSATTNCSPSTSVQARHTAPASGDSVYTSTNCQVVADDTSMAFLGARALP
jgi:hypothetical protein